MANDHNGEQDALANLVRDLIRGTGEEVRLMKERLIAVEHKSKSNATALESLGKRLERIEEKEEKRHAELLDRLDKLNTDFLRIGAEQHERRITEIEKNVDELKKFMWRLIGMGVLAAVVLMWVMNLVSKKM